MPSITHKSNRRNTEVSVLIYRSNHSDNEVRYSAATFVHTLFCYRVSLTGVSEVLERSAKTLYGDGSRTTIRSMLAVYVRIKQRYHIMYSVMDG